MTIVPIGAGHSLETGAAASWKRTLAAGNPGGVTSSYRSTEDQRAQYVLYLKGLGNFALPPGASVHETGRALDVWRASATWLAAHGLSYGWARTPGWNAPNIANPEWWHFEYVSTLDQHQGDRMAALTQITSEDDVFGFKIATSGNVYLVTGRGMTLLTQAEFNLLTRLKRTIDSPPADIAQDPDKLLDGEIAIMDAVFKRITPAPAGSTQAAPIDYAKLAKAVNDDAARRMQG